MSKVIKAISNIILIILIIALLGYFVLRVMGVISIFKVETGSMEDGIHAGDYILIMTKKTYHKNEIVTYKKDDFFITHRIIKIDGNEVVTKGDANNTPDKPIKMNDIVGKVMLSGGILNFLVDFKFGIAGILIFLYLISSYFESRKSEVKKLEE